VRPEIIPIYYIAALDLPDQSGNIGAVAVTKPEYLFTLILLTLSYLVYLLIGLRKDLPASVSDAIPVPARVKSLIQKKLVLNSSCR
jgi:hypothetical protein